MSVPDRSKSKVPVTVLFTHFGDQWIRGSETVLLDLLRHLDRKRILPVVWCNGIEMADACKALDVPTHRSEFTIFFDQGSPTFNSTAYAGVVQTGLRIAQQCGAQVLHANSAAPTQWLVPIARRLRLPLLTHLHIDYQRRGRYALLLHQADLVVGVSAQVLQEPLRDGLAPNRTSVIYNGIDFARLDEKPGYDLRASLGIAPRTLLVGAVGSLVRRKGYDVLIRAIAAFAGENPPHLLIAGDGPELETLRALAAELGLSSRVHFLGYRQPQDLYASCEVVALASRADAFGLVLVEAGYLGRPVVATCVGGIPEVVIHNETGLLVRPDDVAGLTTALRLLVENAGLRARLGAGGRARALSQFSVKRLASEFEATFERLATLPRSELGWISVAGRLGPYFRMFARRG